jgi:hypothetical protein
VKAISEPNRLVNLDVNRQRVKDSPAYDASSTIDQAYDKAFYKYYFSDVRQNDPL